MSIAVGGKSLPIGAVVGAAGGALALVGSVLAWESISIMGLSESDSGLTSNPGKIIAVLGIVAIVVAVVWIQGVKLPAAPIILGCGIVIALLGILNFFTIGDDVKKANEILAGAASTGVGLYIDILAGVVIIAGGALGLMKKAA